MQLSIVIPLYNEAERISTTFRALRNMRVPAGIEIKELIFVNDGSTDATAQKVEDQAALLENQLSTSVKLISYTQNRGKGYAVRQGMLAAKATYALMMDADISTPLSELKKFVSHMEAKQPVIIGTRKNGLAKITKAQPLHRQYLGKGFTLLSQTLLNTWVSDFTCGFKVFHKDARNQIFSKSMIDRWGYDSEILFLARIFNYPITEVAVRWKNDERSRVSVLKDVFQSLSELLHIRKYDLIGSYRPAWPQRAILAIQEQN